MNEVIRVGSLIQQRHGDVVSVPSPAQAQRKATLKTRETLATSNPGREPHMKLMGAA